MVKIEIGDNLRKIIVYILWALILAWAIYVLNEGLILIFLLIILLISSK